MTSTTLEDFPVRFQDLPNDKKEIAMLKLADAWREPGFLEALNEAVCDIYKLFGVSKSPEKFAYGFEQSGPGTENKGPKYDMTAPRADIIELLESWGPLGTSDLDARLPVAYREMLVWEACGEARKKVSLSGSLDRVKMLQAAIDYLRSVWNSHTNREASKRLVSGYCDANELWFDSKGNSVKPPVSLWITQWRKDGDDEDTLDVRLSVLAPDDEIAQEAGLGNAESDDYVFCGKVVIDDGSILDLGPRRFKIEINEVKEV